MLQKDRDSKPEFIDSLIQMIIQGKQTQEAIGQLNNLDLMSQTEFTRRLAQAVHDCGIDETGMKIRTVLEPWDSIVLLADLSINHPPEEAPLLTGLPVSISKRLERICREPFYWWNDLLLASGVLYDRSYNPTLLRQCVAYRTDMNQWVNKWNSECHAKFLDSYLNNSGTSIVLDGHINRFARYSEGLNGQAHELKPISNPEKIRISFGEVMENRFNPDNRKTGDDRDYLERLSQYLSSRDIPLGLIHFMEGIDTHYGAQKKESVVTHMFLVFEANENARIPAKDSAFNDAMQFVLSRLCMHYLWDYLKLEKKKLEDLRTEEQELNRRLNVHLEEIDADIAKLQIQTQKWRRLVSTSLVDDALAWLVRIGSLFENNVVVKDDLPYPVTGSHQAWSDDQMAAAWWYLIDPDINTRQFESAKDMATFWGFYLHFHYVELLKKNKFAKILDHHGHLMSFRGSSMNSLVNSIRNWREVLIAMGPNKNKGRRIPVGLLAYLIGDSDYHSKRGEFSCPLVLGTPALS